MLQTGIELISDAFQESISLFPYLFITYLILEYLEHKTKVQNWDFLGKKGLIAPALGSLLGIIPQCGIAAATANFYAARVITLGTLIAVFLASSDEMLPILIANGVGLMSIGKIFIFKICIATIAGITIDFFLLHKRQKQTLPFKIDELCHQTKCHCEKGIFLSAFWHSIQILIFVFSVLLILNTLFQIIGAQALEQLIFKKSFISILTVSLIGIIPSCAPSVIITQLYIAGTLTPGAFMAGLLVNAGVGILVLFRINRPIKQTVQIMLLLYFISVITGILINLFQITF